MNSDDPKFTAFALDELSPEERAEIQSALDHNPALAAELNELRQFTASLREELHHEEGMPLTPEQRAIVMGLAAPTPTNIVVPERPWWRTPWFASAAAACVMGGLVATIYLQAQHIERLKAGREPVMPHQRYVGMPLKLEEDESLAKAPSAPLPSLAIADPKPDQLGRGATDPKLYALTEKPGAPSAEEWGIGTKPAGISGGGTDKLAVSTPSTASVSGGVATMKAPAQSLGNPVQAGSGTAVGRGLVTQNRYSRYRIKSGLAAAKTKTDGSDRDHESYAGVRSVSGDPEALADVLRQELGELELRLKKTEKEESSNDAELRQTIDQVRRTLESIQGRQDEASNTEAYDDITDNPFLSVTENPLSTFSVDVDSASYTNVRRMLESNQRPPKGAIRIEELVNYFRYDYPQPEGKDPFACAMEVATCPWAPDHRLVRVGLKGREIPRSQRPSANLVFLIDVSGSMEPENKLPLVKECLRLLTDQLSPDDSVSIAVYAGASGCVLEPTHDREKVRAALDRLEAGGSTNGAAGIQLAYNLAQRAFKKGGANRVILCTDGDFNVGISDQSQLVSMIQDKAKTGVFLSVLGFGFGNLKDSTLEKLADKGNGTYGYIDTLAEGRRLFVEQMVGTLVTIAKDVKIQMEFNPAKVAAYRLIGYENRLLAKEDFNNDKKDAGEIGAGHTVTAVYEIVPAGKDTPVTAVDDLKYQPRPEAAGLTSPELLTLKVRYKQPDSDVSTKLEFPLTDLGTTWERSSTDFRWAAAVTGFGMMLRDSPHKGSLSWALVEELASESRSASGKPERAQFVQLLEKARALSR